MNEEEEERVPRYPFAVRYGLFPRDTHTRCIENARNNLLSRTNCSSISFFLF